MDRKDFKLFLKKARNRHVSIGKFSDDVHEFYKITEDNYRVISHKELAKLLSVTWRLGMVEQYLYGDLPGWPAELEDEYEELYPLMAQILKDRLDK